MAFEQLRDLVTQVQTGARVTTAIGDPITVGDRVVIPVAQVAYGGGGGGGMGSPEADEGSPEKAAGGGGGMGVRIRPLGCWVIGPKDETWLPAIDINRAIVIVAGLVCMILATVRVLAKRHH